MSTLTANEKVGEIAARYPATVRVFQKHNIDFCCGGKLPLGEACDAKGIGADSLLEELAAALAPTEGGPADWSRASLTALISHIVRKHHEYVKLEMPRLGAMAAKVAEKHGERHPEMVEVRDVLEGLAEELSAHMMKEEMVLFPLIEQLEAGTVGAAAHCGSVRNPIRVMEYEHDSAGTALARMRELTRDYTLPEDACNTYRGLFHGLQEMEADLHQHIHLENNILFPRATALE